MFRSFKSVVSGKDGIASIDNTYFPRHRRSARVTALKLKRSPFSTEIPSSRRNLIYLRKQASKLQDIWNNGNVDY